MKLIASYTDNTLGELMTNLGGHCMETVLDAFATAAKDDTPTCFIAYTVKGWGLPLQGHKDNHAGLMTPDQIQVFQQSLGIKAGEEWEPFAGLEEREPILKAFLKNVPFNQLGTRRLKAEAVTVPIYLPLPSSTKISTQEAFGRILYDIAGEDSELASRIVTTSPDVTQSTNLGGWVNRRGIFAREEKTDTFRAQQVPSIQKWAFTDAGQHLELGIAENNLFILLAALGLSHENFGHRLLPIGTVYDPFIARGLDALNYACYQDARFMLAGTPSGITLAPEGGAHQSVATPLIGLGQPGLTYFEPAFADELAEIMRWGFLHMQATNGGAIYLRLSTRSTDQLVRIMDKSLLADIVAGGYWLIWPRSPKAGAIIYTGALATEAIAAQEKIPDAGVIAITSADRLYKDWHSNGKDSKIFKLLATIDRSAPVVTVLDGHPATLSWIGSVAGHQVRALGVNDFGQCGKIDELYGAHSIDRDAIVSAYASS